MNFAKYLLASVVIFLFSCSSWRNKTDYMNTPEYREKPVLRKSIMDGVNLTDAEMNKILNSRVQFPKKMRLAVIRIHSTSQNIPSQIAYRDGNLNRDAVDKDLLNNLYEKLQKTKNFESVISVPTSLVSENPNLTQFRNVAVHLQTHLILVVDSNSDLNWDYDIFKSGTVAKSNTVAESYLIDTATGVILTTGIYSDTIEITKNSDDYDRFDVMKRAKLESEKKIFAQVTSDVSSFLDKVH